MIYLGTIVIPSGSSANNTTTAVPFTISQTYKYVLIVTSSGPTSIYATVDTGASLAATTNDFALAPSASTQIACPVNDPGSTVVALRGNGGAGTAAVYGLYGIAQS